MRNYAKIDILDLKPPLRIEFLALFETSKNGWFHLHTTRKGNFQACFGYISPVLYFCENGTPPFRVVVMSDCAKWRPNPPKKLF